MKKILPFLILVASLASQTAPVAADTWTPTTGSMPVARRDHTATLLANGLVLIVGGTNTGALLYDPSTGLFSSTGTPLYEPGQGSTATRLLDGTVLIVGGVGGQQLAQIYDPVEGTFSWTTSAPKYVHSFQTATLLPDGTVLIAGGQDSTTGPTSTNLAELYYPSTGLFALTTRVLNVARTDHSATLLPNGKVLIAGGTETTTPGSGIALSSTELFDPVYQTFTAGPSMSAERSGPMATLLPSGMVLISGWLYTAADLYDPATNAITPTGPMTTPHGAATATLLPDGQVLVAGGFTASGPVTTNSAELYDPVTGAFTATTSMSVARQEQTATLLPGSLVLVVGGYNPTDLDLASAEFFTPTIPQPYSPTAEPLITTGGTNTYQYTSNQKPFSWSAMYPGVLTDPNLVLQPVLISQADLDALVKGTGFDGALIVPYDGTGGFGVLFRATCQDSNGNPVTCPQTTGPYTFNTSWITPSSASTISNPAFLVAPVGTNAWQNDFTGLSTDPTGSGRTCCHFSDFVFVDLGTSVGAAPTITITTPVDGAVYAVGENVLAGYSCSGSYVKSCVGTVPNNSPIDTSSVGTKTFEVNAIVSSGPSADQTVTYQVLNGPLASVSPSSINFGTVYLGTITIKSVTVTNQGNAPMTITDPLLSILSGGDSKEFVALNLCPKSLAAGKSCTIVVGFVAGPYYNPQTATLKVMDNAPGSPQTVALSATVINPQASLSSYSLNFGKQSVGTTSAAQTVTLTSTGATSLTLSTLNIGGDFSFAPGTTCTNGETLTAGASCFISVNFTPPAKGARLGGVTIKDNALLGEQIIALWGTGK